MGMNPKVFYFSLFPLAKFGYDPPTHHLLHNFEKKEKRKHSHN
jgi:hypothetical protein